MLIRVSVLAGESGSEEKRFSNIFGVDTCLHIGMSALVTIP
jgi:hypothetical protein